MKHIVVLSGDPKDYIGGVNPKFGNDALIRIAKLLTRTHFHYVLMGTGYRHGQVLYLARNHIGTGLTVRHAIFCGTADLVTDGGMVMLASGGPPIPTTEYLGLVRSVDPKSLDVADHMLVIADRHYMEALGFGGSALQPGTGLYQVLDDCKAVKFIAS